MLWALFAVSSFNMFLPLWLGATVLLNAERRTWGVWVAGSGLIIAGMFFAFHSLLIAGSLVRLLPILGEWWYLGWGPVIALPYAWYVMMLWFVGFWNRHAERPPIHRYGLALLALMGLSTALMLGFVGATGNQAIIGLDLTGTPSIGIVPVPVIIYSLYILGAFLLSIHALRGLPPSGNLMTDLARKRARPWLIATGSILIVVALMVAWVLFSVVLYGDGRIHILDLLTQLNYFDLLTSLLIGVSMVLLGEAIVSYEIFTGKTLPRQGFRRHWRNTLILAAGFSALLGGVQLLDVPSVYVMLAATLLVALFYALVSWRSYDERERYLRDLRPFLGSQKLYDQFLANPDDPARGDSASIGFSTFCSDVLGARLAYLLPHGPFATLAGGALRYPERRTEEPMPEFPPLPVDKVEELSIPLDPEQYGGAVWGIPLWNQRGCIGALLLGEKRDGGLYTQEEIEIARAGGERMIDIRAGAEMARRLMLLQRRRLAESQVLDARTRRVLHDDVLPQLHALLLTVRSTEASPEESEEITRQITELHRSIADLLQSNPVPASMLLERTGLIGALKELVGVELADSFDGVEWNIEERAAEAVRQLPQLTAEVLFYAARESVRNAVRHGRGAHPRRPLHLRVEFRYRRGLVVVVEDDGVGIASSGTYEGGSGRGLALHETMMAVVGGLMSLESEPERFTRVTFTLSGEE